MRKVEIMTFDEVKKDGFIWIPVKIKKIDRQRTLFDGETRTVVVGEIDLTPEADFDLPEAYGEIIAVQ